MNDFSQEAAIRVGFFLLIFIAVAAAEIAPRRPLTVRKATRWRVNLAITLIDAGVARFLPPILPVGLALLAASRGWGALNLLPVPFWPSVLIVTPDMHRVHHSVIIGETNSNFGFNFPWWDRLFGTYRPQPAMGHDGMTIGLARFRDAGALTLGALLLPPFRRGGLAGRGVAGGRGPDREADRSSGGESAPGRGPVDGHDAIEGPPGARPR